MHTWVISDTHFGHEKIIEYCHRPYNNAGQMDEDMIRKWNHRVQPDDLVYHIGDVGLTKGDYLNKIVPRLQGKKVLILGNHDKSAARMMEFGFDFACEEMVVTHFGKRLLLVHRPQRELPAGVDYVLHGHIHNSTSASRALLSPNKGELVTIPTFNINLSVEVINYEPQTLDSVIKKKVREDKNCV